MQGNYCPYCGKQLNSTAKFCSNCGRPLMPSSYKKPQNRQLNYPINWIFVFAIIAIVIGVSLYSKNESKTWNKTKTFNLFQKPKTTYSIQSIKDIDEMRVAIDNTIWTSTKKGQLIWYKLEFKGDKVKMYKAFPSDGHWTLEEEGPFTLEEGRFTDDGKRYIAAIIKKKDLSISPKFIITSGYLSWLYFFDAEGFVLGDYEWD